MIKVVQVYRKAKPGTYSIEGLFHTIGNELRKHVELIEYEMGKRNEIVKDWAKLRSLKADVYHITGDVHYVVLGLPWRKCVLTIHDIGHYVFTLTGIRRFIYKVFWLVLPIRCARSVTVISNDTLESIAKHLRLSMDGIEVIPNCYDPMFKHVPRDYRADKPTILQPGTNPHKNVPRLAEALRGIRCKLLLIGRVDSALHKILKENDIEYENCQNISREDVFCKYVESDIVTFISTNEGFGLPILEAFATGRPLVSSKTSPMSDVAGDAACLVDCFNVADIHLGILKVISDSSYRTSLIEKGFRRARKFSVEEVAARYLDVYRRLIVE